MIFGVGSCKPRNRKFYPSRSPYCLNFPRHPIPLVFYCGSGLFSTFIHFLNSRVTFFLIWVYATKDVPFSPSTVIFLNHAYESEGVQGPHHIDNEDSESSIWVSIPHLFISQSTSSKSWYDFSTVFPLTFSVPSFFLLRR